MSASSRAGGERPGQAARLLAVDALRRIDDEGAYANLLLPRVLDQSELDDRDRRLATEIVYGATRMRASVDWLVDRFLISPPPAALRAALRVGAYQLAFMRIPPHAAVSATVDATPRRGRGMVNAVLRKVAASLPVEWPDEATRLSYPAWLVDLLIRELGEQRALAMMERMNVPATVAEREDGYVQDEASQWVADLVDAGPTHSVLDMCAAPGGKATAIAPRADLVVAADMRPHRARLVVANASRLGCDNIRVVVADGTAPPFRERSFDRVLVDAPCSGLGVLRRRPDARWRVSLDQIRDLSALQLRLLESAAGLVAPGGSLVYSVCTVTRAETVEVAEELRVRRPDLVPLPIGDARWTGLGSGARLLPQDHDTDGMTVFRWSVPA